MYRDTRRTRQALPTIILAVLALGGCEGPSPEAEPGARPAVSPPPAAEVPGAEGPVIDEVQWDLQQARNDFVKGSFEDCAEGIERAGGRLQHLAQRSVPGVRQDLEASALALGELAPRVRDGAVASVVQLDSAMAIADYAMARYHHAAAEEAVVERAALHSGREISLVGRDLTAAAEYLETGFGRLEQPIDSSAASAISAARDMGEQMVRRRPVDQAEVEQVLAGLGQGIERLKEMVMPQSRGSAS